MKIRVTLGQIGNAIKKIEGYQKRFKEKQQLFLQRLAELGVAEASIRFKDADYPGTNDVVVETPVWISENRIAIRATGHSVTFIEFGTGVTYTDQHEKASELGFTRGGYGKGQGKNKFWLYRGEVGKGNLATESTAVPGLNITRGNPPNRCLWETDKVIRARIAEIAREVFKSD